MLHIKSFTGSVDLKISTHDAHIQQKYTDIYHISGFSKFMELQKYKKAPSFILC